MNTIGDIEAVEDFIDTLLTYSRKQDSLLTLVINNYIGTAQLGTDDGRTGGKVIADLDTKVYGTGLPMGGTDAVGCVVAEKAVDKTLALDRQNG
ncbi:hypothetical protein F5X99DRAFT_405969 [Biscogniauxia marginata]|nr:hypothetical protein F5X99DRAFT_405969 [Biscogniauxia marginata]